nr:glycine-rich cell wall structural protein 1.0-like [Aegilops tauschii subsp. strangulata]
MQCDGPLRGWAKACRGGWWHWGGSRQWGLEAGGPPEAHGSREAAGCAWKQGGSGCAWKQGAAPAESGRRGGAASGGSRRGGAGVGWKQGRRRGGVEAGS